MEQLFELASDLVHLKFSLSSNKGPTKPPGQETSGRLVITTHRAGLTWQKAWRQGTKAGKLPATICRALSLKKPLKMYARSQPGHKLDIIHRDPVIRDLDYDDVHSMFMDILTLVLR